MKKMNLIAMAGGLSFLGCFTTIGYFYVAILHLIKIQLLMRKKKILLKVEIKKYQLLMDELITVF
nr:hypothetical protein [Mycoplasmopsis bovis]